MVEINGTKYRHTAGTRIELRNLVFTKIHSFEPKGCYIMTFHNVTGNPQQPVCFT